MADKTIPAGPTYRAPQLADALNSLEIKDPKIALDCSQFKAPGESSSKPSLTSKEIKPILTHIIRRLREGLDKCWATTEGKGDFTNPSASEEAWARQVT